MGVPFATRVEWNLRCGSFGRQRQGPEDPDHLGNGGGLPGWRAAGVDVGAAVIGILLLLAARAVWSYGATAVARHGIAKEES